MTLSYFITGTDTGVGKTLVSCALLRSLARRHGRAVGMKPVAAGADTAPDGRLVNEDVSALRAAGNVVVPAELDNPYVLAEPVSPHIAARLAGQRIDPALIEQRYRQLATLADAVVVEGAGGFCVPLNDTETSADLAQRLGLPVVLVVGLRLGCLNHALLTQEAILARGLRLAGWVANRIDPAMASAADNLDTLRARLAAPMLADVPWMAQPDAAAIDIRLPDPATQAEGGPR
ncbi:dethiobiotin synthase [Methylibium rhizosphaerae]|uniref:dethiobiotin synthase n=1 Tax=Methylibium rhizosphaerae TaxID=2570323 RepID=UPI00112D5E29|nr:dethiobiotin synthase [Methylibium rhizosphaerae]